MQQASDACLLRLAKPGPHLSQAKVRFPPAADKALSAQSIRWQCLGRCFHNVPTGQLSCFMVFVMMRSALITITLISAIQALVVMGLVLGAFRAPTSGSWAVIGSTVWAPFGPFLLLGALLSLALGLLTRRHVSPRFGSAVALLAAIGTAGSAFILFRIGQAASAAGVSVDLPATLFLADMDVPQPDAVETFRVVEGADLRAAIYRPPASNAPLPVVVYIHGGGFMTGSFTETAADLRWFADQGWLVVSVEYRLFGPDRPTWNRAPEDVACALVWVSRNASRFGGDPKRIAVMGDSAGGNLAVNLGYAAAAGRAPAACGKDVAVPVAIAALYPALDPISIYENGFPIPGFEPRMLIEGYIGGPPDAYPRRIAAITSANFLTPAAPPTLIVLPENDSLVVKEGTLGFAVAAAKVGVDLTLVTLPFANHVFNQMAANSLGNQIARTIRQEFLSQHSR